MHHAWTLVTGASGFLGTHVVHQLIERGEHVKAFVRPGTNLKAFENLPQDRFQLAFGDVTIEHTVYRALASCTTLYHCAANTKLWDRKPERIIDAAVAGTRATLKAAKKRNLKKIVYTSTCGILGATTAAEPMDETHEFNLNDPETYFLAKLESQKVADEFLAEGMPIVSVLPATIVGPGDWKPSPNGSLLLRYLKTSPGSKFPISGGGVNLVAVEDVARGHILAMQKGRIGERYILAGENLTLTQAFEMLCDLTGLAEPTAPLGKGLLQFVGTLLELKARFWGGDPIITSKLARDYAGSYVYFDTAKAERELGYKAGSVREATARAVRWFIANGYVPDNAASRVRLELRPA
jgi:dihydroflavonol-4-reductase